LRRKSAKLELQFTGPTLKYVHEGEARPSSKLGGFPSPA
jgi:hypothetical protein